VQSGKLIRFFDLFGHVSQFRKRTALGEITPIKFLLV
jgi:hypothetical protein